MGNIPCKKGYSAIEASLTNLEINQAAADKCIFVALYNFPLSGQTDLSIHFGEQLNILSEDGDWLKVSSASTGQECYLPTNYVAKVCNRWLYKGINREKAEELLMVNSNRSGSFLIRESETRSGSYTLSIRKTNHTSRDSIKHYRIHQLDNGWFYIAPRLTFATLQDMVDYYSEVADGICCTLTEPCVVQRVPNPVIQRPSEPIVVRKPTLNWTKLDSMDLFNKDDKLNEDCPLSLGLREAVSSYMLMTQDSESMTEVEKEHWWKTC
ncbi:uncharacterized protein LOC379549 [Xenopus laevis]|uniref:MGC68984 protein n=1 Tax=Xenopus laevis TaxID=8355 RepID=Q7T0U4_XENLA|nr:uncharacterized protein LOC379549 [Xenopus laevis]AAH56035.1 MGC68984 protein [Xenopus laevis]